MRATGRCCVVIDSLAVRTQEALLTRSKLRGMLQSRVQRHTRTDRLNAVELPNVHDTTTMALHPTTELVNRFVTIDGFGLHFICF